MKSIQMVIYIKLTLTAFFWGGTFIAAKSLANGVDPYSAAFIRFTIASFFLIIITRRLEGHLPRVTLKQMVPLTLLGLTGVFSYNLFFFNGLHYISAGKAALIIATNPICISLLSAFIFKEAMGVIKAMGILTSVAGALIVISGGHPLDLMGYHLGQGEWLIMGCVASWVAYSLLGKSVMGFLSPVASVCYSSVIGTVLLFFPAVIQGDLASKSLFAYTPSQWFSLFYLGFFGTVLGFFWYYEGIREIGPMRSSVFINFVPISALILAAIILKEPVTPSLLTGGILVLTGVYAVNASGLLKQYFLRKEASREQVRMGNLP